MLEKIKRYTIPSNEDLLDPCKTFLLESLTIKDVDFTYYDCHEGLHILTVLGNSSEVVCASEVIYPGTHPTEWNITFLGNLC